jgi:hypothetical protein
MTPRAFAEWKGVKHSPFITWLQGRRPAGRTGAQPERFAKVPVTLAPVFVGLSAQWPHDIVVRGTSASEVAQSIGPGPAGLRRCSRFRRPGGFSRRRSRQTCAGSSQRTVGRVVVGSENLIANRIR